MRPGHRLSQRTALRRVDASRPTVSVARRRVPVRRRRPGPAVRVRKDWRVDGLQLEDTVVHYDTVTGDTYVQPSNRVCVYAPRFAAVRKVYGIVQHDGHEQLSGIENPVPLEGLGDVQIATTTVQPVQPGLNLGTLAPSGFRERTPPTGLENSQALTGMHGELLPYEDFTLIRRGQMDNSEKARLAERVAAAVAWSHDTAVQVMIDDVALQEDVRWPRPSRYTSTRSRANRACRSARSHRARSPPRRNRRIHDSV